jgi:hypothetical protein
MVLGLSLLFDKDADCASLLTQRRLFDRGVEVIGLEVTRFEFESEELGAFSDCEDPFLDGMFGRMPGMTQVKGTCSKEGEVCAIIN